MLRRSLTLKAQQKAADAVEEAVAVADVDARGSVLAGHQSAGVRLRRLHGQLVQAQCVAEALHDRERLLQARSVSAAVCSVEVSSVPIAAFDPLTGRPNSRYDSASASLIAGVENTARARLSSRVPVSSTPTSVTPAALKSFVLGHPRRRARRARDRRAGR